MSADLKQKPDAVTAILERASNPQPVPEPPPPLMDAHTFHVCTCIAAVDDAIARIDAMQEELGRG